MVPFVVGTFVCVATMLFAEQRKASALRAISKTLAAFGFIGAALHQGALDEERHVEDAAPGSVLRGRDGVELAT